MSTPNQNKAKDFFIFRYSHHHIQNSNKLIKCDHNNISSRLISIKERK
jgi:hypothetical protein